MAQIRVDVYTFVDSVPEYLRSFDSILRAVEFIRPIGMIPGNKIGFIIYDGRRPVDVMVW